MRLRFIALIAVCLAAGFLVACGGDDSSSDNSSKEAANTPTEAAPEATTEDSGGASSGTVKVAADPDGKLAFVPSTLSAGTGKVKIEFTNESGIPHDFDLEDADGKEVAEVPVITKGKDSVTADLKAGKYTFYCSVANHRESGMEGTLTAK